MSNNTNPDTSKVIAIDNPVKQIADQTKDKVGDVVPGNHQNKHK